MSITDTTVAEVDGAFPPIHEQRQFQIVGIAARSLAAWRHAMRFRNRLKALEKALPKHSGLYTLEEVCRAIWRESPTEFRQLAECSSVRLLIPQFEQEDAGRKAKETMRLGGRSKA